MTLRDTVTVLKAPDPDKRLARPSLHWRDALVWRAGSPIWYRFAFSVVVSAGIPLYLLAGIGHLELALYTMAGSMQALFGHDRPFAARARLLGGLTAGQLLAVAVSLALSAAAPPTLVLVVAGAVVVTAQKLLCDAARVGPPAQAVLSFITLGIMFGPVTPVAEIPRDLLLYLAGAAIAFLVSMAPWLWNRTGPQDDIVRAAERLVAEEDERRAGAAITRAWDMLARSDPRSPVVLAAARRVLAAEDMFLGHAGAQHADEEVRRHLAVRRAQLPAHPALLRLRADSPLWRAALLCLVGTFAGGLVALAIGLERPYWAIVAAGAVYRGSTSVIWERALLRTAGTIAGVFLYAGLAPIAHINDFWLVTLTLLTAFGIESFVSRNYAVGNLWVAPMALLMANFAEPQPTAALMTSRALDTAIGATLGLGAALVFTNHRATNQVAVRLRTLERSVADAKRALGEQPSLGAAERIVLRDRVGRAMADLEDAAQEAAGEWRVPTVPAERVLNGLAEARGVLRGAGTAHPG